MSGEQKVWSPGTFDELAGEDARIFRRKGEMRAVLTDGPFALIHPTEGVLQTNDQWRGYVAVDEHGFCFHEEEATFLQKYAPEQREASDVERDLRHAIEELAPRLDEAIDIITGAIAPEDWPDWIPRPDADAEAGDPDKARAAQGT